MSKMKRLQRSEEDQSFNQQLVLWGETLLARAVQAAFARMGFHSIYGAA